MDQLKRANFHGGLQHPDSRVLGQLAHAETGAKGAHAAVLGLHDKGTLLRILGGLNQDFTLVQTKLNAPDLANSVLFSEPFSKFDAILDPANLFVFDAADRLVAAPKPM